SLDNHATIDRILLVIRGVCIGLRCRCSGWVSNRYNGRSWGNRCNRCCLATVLGRWLHAASLGRSHGCRAMDFTVQSHVLLGYIGGPSLKQVSHVDLSKFLDCLGWESTLGSNVFNNPLNAL